MARQIEMGYLLPKTSIDSLHEQLTYLRNGRIHLASHFRNSVSCDIRLEFESRAASVTLRETLGSPENTLESALHLYLCVAGFPQYFTQDSDIRCCNTVLSKYLKITRRNAGFALGKSVADIVFVPMK